MLVILNTAAIDQPRQLNHGCLIMHTGQFYHMFRQGPHKSSPILYAGISDTDKCVAQIWVPLCSVSLCCYVLNRCDDYIRWRVLIARWLFSEVETQKQKKNAILQLETLTIVCQENMNHDFVLPSNAPKYPPNDANVCQTSEKWN